MKDCKEGEIKRVGYTYIKSKSNSTKVNVKSTCVKDMGKPGKGPKLIVMPSKDVGILSDYGYHMKDKYEERIKAIKRSLKDNSKLKLIRHINALRTLFKSNIMYYNKLDKDLKWLQNL